MELLVTLLIALAIIGIVWWCVQSLPLPPPVRMVAIVVVALVAILMLLRLAPHAVI